MFLPVMDGDVFGEIALLTEQPRSATIAAKDENTVHAMRLAKADVSKPYTSQASKQPCCFCAFSRAVSDRDCL